MIYHRIITQSIISYLKIRLLKLILARILISNKPGLIQRLKMTLINWIEMINKKT